MHLPMLRRAIIRWRRNAHRCLAALALALTLETVVSPPPSESKISVVGGSTPTPLVNWNS
jgi:hypothetical protein